jgi:hypothetical protein
LQRSVFPSQRFAMIAAFLIAPCGPAIWGVAWSVLWGQGDGVSPAGFAFLFYTITLPFGILLGTPVLLLLAKIRHLAWWTAILTGVVAGVLVSVVLHLPLPLYAPVGPAWSLLFYVVWKAGPEPTDSVALSLFWTGRRVKS